MSGGGFGFSFPVPSFIKCISGGGMTLVTKDMMGRGFDHLLLEAKPVSYSLWEVCCLSSQNERLWLEDQK